LQWTERVRQLRGRSYYLITATRIWPHIT
jgi:hypothetical protein